MKGGTGKLRWGVLGCANFARTRALPAMRAASSVDLVAVASRSMERACAFQQEFAAKTAFGSYEELIAAPGVDAVYIPLPKTLHAEWTIRALRAGKHVLCEKPLAVTAAEAESVAAAARETGLHVMEAFMWRLHPQHARARELIRQGRIGAVRLIRGAFTFTISREPNIRLMSDLGGGSLMDVGCYPISAARYYFDAEPLRAIAFSRTDPEYGVDIAVSGALEFEQGMALFDCGFHLPFRGELEVHGETGSLLLPAAWLPPEKAALVVGGQTEELPPADQYVLEFEAFSRAVLDNRPLPFDAEDAVRQARALDAVRRAAQSGRAEPL